MQIPPPLLDEDPLPDGKTPLLDEAAPPVLPEADDDASPPAPPAEEPEVDAALDDDVEPPLPLLTEDEQPTRASVGVARVMKSAKEDRLFIPGA